MFTDYLVGVKGGGDLATGVAWRLHRCGFPVVVTELSQPTVVRRTVAFAEAIYSGQTTVQGVSARRVEGVTDVWHTIKRGEVPVLVDPQARCFQELKPQAVVDAIMAKRNTGTRLAEAPIVIGLGPGFRAGADVHAVVETNRGHNLGRVLWEGSAEPNTGVPGVVGGYAEERVLRAPGPGTVRAARAIGDRVAAGEVVAWVGEAPVVAGIPGVVRGLIESGLEVRKGMKLGDVDPSGQRERCFTISDKALAVAGGVLEAILTLLSQRHSGER